MISYCDIVEDRIVESMKQWWKEVTLDIAPKEHDSMTEETQLDMMRKQLKIILSSKIKSAVCLNEAYIQKKCF